MNISIIGISEMGWPDSGNINIENHKVFYSGSTTGIHKHGLLNTPVDVNIIQVYVPMADKEENEVEEFCINEVINKLKKQDLTIGMGDLQCKTGSREDIGERGTI
ncbi:craniofacial development protein 2-like [Aphis craccivora]|uniref:Craniofacial development protein 2-like n=1 Tax=Aphis craccivora TaxID=307492 RepID=A0A6G0Z932_APHCR|nr:craniofacial development protein 2-like [Aphis craccivora]